MIFGTGKPKLTLRPGNGVVSEADELLFDYAPSKLLPSFIPDLIKQKTLDNTMSVYNRCHWVKISVEFPVISDTDYRKLIDMMKHQFDIDENGQFTIAFQPRSDHSEVYIGWITTPIDILNEYHFLTHGAEFEFEGQTGYDTNEFLMSNEPLSPSSPVTSSKTDTTMNIAWTAPTGGCDGYMVVMKAGSTPTDAAVNGTVYSVSDSLGGGTVKKYGTGVTLALTGLTTATTYHFLIYAYNGTVYNVVYSSYLSYSDTTS